MTTVLGDVTPGVVPSRRDADHGSPASARADADELRAKAQRVRDALTRVGADAVTLTSAAALAWLFDGARFHVSLAGPPVARAVVHHAGVLLVAPSNEADRLVHEELGDTVCRALSVTVRQLPWHVPFDAARGLVGLNTVEEESLGADLQFARAALLPAEEARYRALCRDLARGLTDVLQAAGPGDREDELGAAVSAMVAGLGAEPLVVLVGGQDRRHVRHPLPTATPLGRRAMVVVCGRRHGMVANLTRWVRFGPATPSENARDRAICEVEADAFDVLRPGLPLVDLLGVVQRSYPRHGFPADEWERHHQGGPAGYAGRDPRLTPGVAGRLGARSPVTLNPTAMGVKVEDTVIVSPAGPEVLTVDERWPTVCVRGRRRPEVLELA